MEKPSNQKIGIALVLSLTLGLAPFFPQPHLFGKVQWALGGGVGMKGMDYFDLLLHGAPWVYLVSLLVIRMVGTNKNSER
ncbi:MAG: hypothetical protein RIM99_13545 [Cyclobacteriaceae bacterium]